MSSPVHDGQHDDFVAKHPEVNGIREAMKSNASSLLMDAREGLRRPEQQAERPMRFLAELLPNAAR